MTGDDRLSLAAAVATLVAGVPFVALTQDRSYLLLGFVLMLGSVAIGVFARRAGSGELGVRLAQLLPVVLLPLLVPALASPWRLAGETMAFVQESFAPMPYQAGFAVFTALLLWLTYLTVETLAIGLRSPAWTFPALVMPYAVSAFAIYNEADPLMFGFTAVAFVGVLAVGFRNQILDALPGPAARGRRTGVTLAAAATTGLALILSALATIPIPERSENAANPGGGAVQLSDPSIDLIRNVNSASDKTLFSYTTSDSVGQYLRLAALPVFDDRGFHLSATDLVQLPMAADRPRTLDTDTVRTSVKIADFGSEYLPIPWLPTAAELAPNWRYDPRTLAVVAIGDGRRTASRNLEYTVTSERLPAVDQFLPAVTEAGRPLDGGVSLGWPDELSPEIRELAERVTAGKRTAGEKALALRDFLSSDAFTYSTVVAPGTTLQTLNDFLLGSRIGYCEQFAGGLAVLARLVGIPSRVVVGFLPGKQVGDTWEVSGRNMHAWAELYFGDGIGWVPLDGTPSGAVGAPSPSASASSTPGVTPTPSASSVSATPVALPDSPTAPSEGALPWALPLLGAAFGVGLVAAGPRLVRRLLRWRRLAARPDQRRAIEEAWAEVRAVVRDQGVAWPPGSSRQVAAFLAPELDAAAGAELTELALLVERTRYSGEPVTTAGLPGRVDVIALGMKKRWAEPTAWLRRWWPRSLWLQRPSS